MMTSAGVTMTRSSSRGVATLLGRLRVLFTRRARARNWGISFQRAASFVVPDSVILAGERHSLFVPFENGVRVAFLELLLDDCYGLRELSHDVTTILDIGANVGLFGLAARRAFPKAVIHAYEPNLRLEDYLKNQARIARFTYFMEAVGLDRGFVTLDDHEDSVQTRSHRDAAGLVPQVPFKAAIQRLGGTVDLVKMDCEGAEWEILKDRHTWRHVRCLSMEYHLWSSHTHEEAHHLVQALGFLVRKQVPFTGFGLLQASRR
jgi:FkbM family methyltransferase